MNGITMTSEEIQVYHLEDWGTTMKQPQH